MEETAQQPVRRLFRTRAIISILCFVMITSTLCMTPLESSYAAPPTDGAVGTTRNNFMTANSPTSGNQQHPTPDNTASNPELVPGYWIDYLNTIWQTNCQSKFAWADVSAVSNMSPAFTGVAASTANTNATAPQTNPTMIPYHTGTTTKTWSVWSGEQLYYVLTHLDATGDVINIMQNLNMNGPNVNWADGSTAASYKVYLNLVTINGNGFGIYNLGTNTNVTGSFDGGALSDITVDTTIENLTFYNAKMVGPSGTYGDSLFGIIDASSTGCTIQNVHVKNSLIFSSDKYDDKTTSGSVKNEGCSFLFGYSTSGSPTVLNKIKDCSIENSYAYGLNHVSAFGSYAGYCAFSNSYAINTTVISTGYHSGGFVSCYEGYSTFTSCFTNNTVYGAYATGVFVGEASEGVFTDCYTSGYVEGYSWIGGFVGYTESGFYASTTTLPSPGKAGQVIFDDCYSTSMVGMETGGTKVGGFIGGLYYYIAGNSKGVVFNNCYAAGEVGDVGTVVTPPPGTNSTTAGGFLGIDESAPGVTNTYSNCYYDKQTTGMREWVSSTSQAITGITGLLTTDTTVKPGTSTGLSGTTAKAGITTANGWAPLTAELYPQLTSFASAAVGTGTGASGWADQATADLVKAYSEASVATVFCDTYEWNYNHSAVLPATTYDTVRDVTQNVPMTTLSATAWNQIPFMALDPNNVIITIPQYPTVDLYGQGAVPVVTMATDSNGYTAATQLAPGIQWLAVQATVNGQVGVRNIRLIPTANLQAGADQTLKAGDTYNHAEDVRMAYSTGLRMEADATDVTQGVFPDDPMDNSQSTIQNPMPASYASAFNAANNQYLDVDVNHMELNKLHTEGVASNASTGVMYVSGVKSPSTNINLDNNNTTIDDKFNAVTPFTNADAGVYTLTYDWVLQDGRFLEDSKVITLDTVMYTITEEYHTVAGSQVDPTNYPDASWTAGLGDPFYALNQQGDEPPATIGNYTYIGYKVSTDSATLISGNPPSPLIDAVSGDQTIIYVYQESAMSFTFRKEAAGSDDPLSGVVFTLTPKNSSGSGWDAANATTTSSATNGQVSFTNLSNGDYLLQETATQPTYALPAGDWVLDVNATAGTISITAQGSPMAFAHDSSDDLILYNYPNWATPMTGQGFGVLFLIVIGTVLIGLALFISPLRKRRRRKRMATAQSGSSS